MSRDFFLLPFLYPGENNMYLNGACSSWNPVLLETKYFFLKKQIIKI